LYRAIYLETNKRGMQDQFEVTLEATHHGPYASIPACFVEIGIDMLSVSLHSRV
jgi:D-tyrosyl-tRNA(Tyr) deacylase